MSLDPYQYCPCGSGKKLKFCCQAIADEMEKAIRLYQGHQVQSAMRAMEGLAEKHPENPWIGITRGTLLNEEGRYRESMAALAPVVREHPEHVLALATLGTAAMASEGFAPHKPLIHRIFQRCAKKLPDIVSSLAMGVAAEMLGKNHVMATRRHLAFALRVATDDDRNEIFQRLVRLDGSREFPFLFRSVHSLAEITTSEEIRNEARKAASVAERGCFGPAGVLFSRCAEQDPENADLWWNVGLCRAWDGDEQEAADALHRAAQLQNDPGKALEFEALAQLLEGNTARNSIPGRALVYRPKHSLSKVISLLSDEPRCVSIRVSDAFPNHDGKSEGMPVALFLMMNRPGEDLFDAEAAALDDIPQVAGRLVAFDTVPEQDPRPRLALTGYGDLLDDARRIFEDVVGEEAEPPESDEPEILEPYLLPREFEFMKWEWYFTENTPPVVRSRLIEKMWRRVIDEKWPRARFAALGDRSPEQAASDPAAALPLAATVVVLDAYCDMQSYMLDIDEVRRRLGVAAPPSIEVSDETSIVALSAWELERLPLDRLTDEQLLSTMNRANLVAHSRFVRRVLHEVLSRSGLEGKIDHDKIRLTLFELAVEANDRPEAIRWLNEGKQLAEKQDDSFEATLKWEFREFTFRIADPDDAEMLEVAHRLWEHYGRKLPNIRQHVREILIAFGRDVPWDQERQGAENAAEGGLWTPETATPTESQSGGLWLPGQD